MAFLFWHFSPFYPSTLSLQQNDRAQTKVRLLSWACFPATLAQVQKNPCESENTSKQRKGGKEKGKSSIRDCLFHVTVQWCFCTVCTAVLLDGDLTCRDVKKADCTVIQPLYFIPPLPQKPLGRSEKNKERERDVGVLCMKVKSEEKKKKWNGKSKSIHPNDHEWMYGSWKCTFDAITPSYHDPSLSNGFTVTNVPSVHHLRAIIMGHYCICNLRYGIYSLQLFFHI